MLAGDPPLQGRWSARDEVRPESSLRRMGESADPFTPIGGRVIRRIWISYVALHSAVIAYTRRTAHEQSTSDRASQGRAFRHGGVLHSARSTRGSCLLERRPHRTYGAQPPRHPQRRPNRTYGAQLGPPSFTFLSRRSRASRLSRPFPGRRPSHSPRRSSRRGLCKIALPQGPT